MTAIRPVRASELERLREIEVAAGAVFREVGMADIADDPPPSPAVLDAYRVAGRCWVCVPDSSDGDGVPVAYVLVDMVDACAHVAQVSVHPSHAGRRLGAALLDHVDAWAAGRGLAGLTLTTFTDVPWNAPYYRRLGFDDVDRSALAPGLAAVVAHEAAIGLDPARRVCLFRPLRTCSDRG